MGYSARRGFSSGSMKATGAQRQAAVQQQIAQMQEAMNAAQTEVENRSFTASVGGGAVEAVANGKKELTALTIKPEAVDPEDVEMLQDLVVSAVNEALRQAGDAMDKAIDSVTGGLNLGGLGL
nr:YbaB/EbfC family nucleoid-associated protein [uncultured Oscillibacter sp.]